MKYLTALLIFASMTATAGDWSVATEVNEINAGYKGGMILFNTVAPHHNPNTECNNGIYSVQTDYAEVDHILSILLAAQRSGAKIKVGVASAVCSTDGNKYIAVSRVKIQK